VRVLVSARRCNRRKDDIGRKAIRVTRGIHSVGHDVALGAGKRAPDWVIFQVSLVCADAGERAVGVASRIHRRRRVVPGSMTRGARTRREFDDAVHMKVGFDESP
jgi:hypothetical protein